VVIAAARQQRHQRQGRDHRQILEQQHRESQLSRLAAVHPLVAHKLERHRGGGHRETNAANHRRLPGKVGQHQQPGKDRGAEQHLRRPDAKDRLP